MVYSRGGTVDKMRLSESIQRVEPMFIHSRVYSHNMALFYIYSKCLFNRLPKEADIQNHKQVTIVVIYTTVGDLYLM